jgi:hypothetical protein
MKKIRIIIVFVFLVLMVVCCVRFYSKGHSTTYHLGDNKEYEIKEIYTKNQKEEVDNYYLEIKYKDTLFSFQLFDTYNEKRNIVEDIMYYDGDYKCMLPIIDGISQTDIMCYKDNRYYNYASIIGKEIALDKFVNDIDINIYDKNKYLDESTEVIEKEGLKLYTYNVNKDHYIAISNLKGVYLIEDSIKDIDIFEKDIYARELSAVVGNYYVTADYSAKQQFRTFYFVELSTGKKKEAKAPNYISFDSYIQGVVENKLYIYDKDNEKQYEIDTEELEIKEVGNERKKIKYYENGEWDKITVTKANKEVVFNYLIEDEDLSKFDYVYLIGGEKTGYYYMYEKTGQSYSVYRTPVQNKKNITYLFRVKNINDVYYVEDFVYYKYGNTLKYYSDYTGNRTIIEYDEIEFNDNLVFGIYKRK